jgi:hypothetical protein
MTVVSDHIIQLQSYAWNDWIVSQAERRQVVALLRADRDMPGTIRDLRKAGHLDRMLKNFVGGGSDGELIELAEVLGAGAGSAVGATLEGWSGWTPRVRFLFRISCDLHESYRGLGAALAARSYSPGLFPKLVPSGSAAAQAPFGGAGATGVPGTKVTVPLMDQYRLWRADAVTVARYSNPIPGSLPDYLAGLSPAQRRQQARHLLARPIHSIVPYSYRQGRPSRADVVIAAGRRHQLEPALVAAFILAEQRDQSRNEDAKDYAGAVNPISRANTSIGLGQVVISTARRHDLFADLLLGSRASLAHEQIAELLVSEEFNIFAVARYLRITAHSAVRHSARSLPETVAKFPKIDFARYGSPSSAWPIDNVKALGSEYTSRPWDDRLSPGWGDFVYEAYRDIKSSGMF